MRIRKLAFECPLIAAWDSFEGDERKRFCTECRMHVHDLSACGPVAAEELRQRHLGGENICIRFVRDAEGTVLFGSRAKAAMAAIALAAASPALADGDTPTLGELPATNASHSAGVQTIEDVEDADCVETVTVETFQIVGGGPMRVPQPIQMTGGVPMPVPPAKPVPLNPVPTLPDVPEVVEYALDPVPDDWSP